MSKILMVGIYDIKRYSRGRNLYRGLKLNKVNVELCIRKGILKYIWILYNLLHAQYDAVLVTGKICLLMCIFAKLFTRKPLIFDAFISDYDTLVKDRKLVPEKSIRAKLLWLGDRCAVRMSDLVILDTRAHIRYFVKEFNLDAGKFRRVFAGADDSVFYPRKNIRNKKFTVAFHGTFIPLQGTEYIIKAAKILEHEEIMFSMAGAGQAFEAARSLKEKLGLENVEFRGMLPLEELPSAIQKGDVCLGIFGSTGKAARVIPNKAFEIIASAKPLITSDSPAIREMFTDKVNCILCRRANAESLAKAIRKLKKDSRLRQRLAAEGYSLFRKKCSPKIIGKEMKKIIDDMLK